MVPGGQKLVGKILQALAGSDALLAVHVLEVLRAFAAGGGRRFALIDVDVW